MAEPHHPPYPLQQQQQVMAPWYGVPPHAYQPQQAPAPPMPHHSMPWSTAPRPPPPPGEQGYNYLSQPYHPPPQSDFYHPPHQIQQQYPLPPQPPQAQFTYMYGQQDQVWQANNSWGYQQWPYPAQNASLSQEEVWAAKARAWAASKAVQDESRLGTNAPQMYHDSMYQPQESHSSEGQQHPLQPPGQEPANVPSYQNNVISQGQNVHSRMQSEHPPQTMTYDQTKQDMPPSVAAETVLESLEQNTAFSGGQLQANDSQSMFSASNVHDAVASYKLDSTVPGPPVSDRHDPISLHPPLKQLPAAPTYNQQATHLLPQSQASPLISQPRLTYPGRLSPSGFEHQQPQASPSYLQPPPNQQPPAQVQHQLPKLPIQPHYQPSVTTDGVEVEFGRSPGALQNWAPVGGPGMPFPPAMGAGTSQFDPVCTNHQIPGPWRPDGAGLQGVGFPSSAPFVVGSSPGIGPGAGVPGRTLFASDSYLERPKKQAVPSWLREEIMKKKAVGLAGNASGMLLSDESSRVNGGEPTIPLRAGISDKLRSSTPGLSENEEEDEEEEIEAARSAAINQEIKRLLTEVLLKVTGDLFEEIAQEVLDEDGDDTLQGKSSPEEQSKEHISPSSPDATTALSGRVLVPTLKDRDTGNMDNDNESSDSGVTAGDVLGLGSYASDDETADPKDYQEPLHGLHKKEEVLPLNSEEQNKPKAKADDHGGEVAGGPFQSLEQVHAHEVDTIENPQLMKEKEVRNNHDDGKPQLQEGDSSVPFVNVDPNTERDVSPVQKGVVAPIPHAGSTSSNDRSRIHVNIPHEDQKAPASSKGLVMARSSTSASKGERQQHDKNHPSSDSGTAFNSSLDAKLEKNKDVGLHGDSIRKHKPKEEKEEAKPRDYFSKERKREEKSKLKVDMSTNSKEPDERQKVKADSSGKERISDHHRTKDDKETRQPRGSDARVGEPSRERRKEKDRVKEKEKSKVRQRESADRDRERRKQESRDREGRSRRADAVEGKARHRSSSSSSGEISSSNSDRSRGRRVRSRRSKHHTSASSPGRSRKRRASRSRSRSRSPHVKHSHRRNVPSPSHDQSRRTGSKSKSPVHRRGRG